MLLLRTTNRSLFHPRPRGWNTRLLAPYPRPYLEQKLADEGVLLDPYCVPNGLVMEQLLLAALHLLRHRVHRAYLLVIVVVKATILALPLRDWRGLGLGFSAKSRACGAGCLVDGCLPAN